MERYRNSEKRGAVENKIIKDIVDRMDLKKETKRFIKNACKHEELLNIYLYDDACDYIEKVTCHMKFTGGGFERWAYIDLINGFWGKDINACMIYNSISDDYMLTTIRFNTVINYMRPL